jgi:signal transduction histidine kinase
MRNKVWSMSPERNKPRTMLSWLSVSALFVLCGVLGVLQYRWIGEVSTAARERLRGTLQASLNRFSRDFNSEISAAARAIVPLSPPDARAVEAELPSRYEQWKKTARHNQMFRRVAIAIPQEGTVLLRNLDLNTGALAPMEWPGTWSAMKKRLWSFASVEPREGRGWPASPAVRDGSVFEAPIFGNAPPSPPRSPFGRREIAWVVFELNVPHVRDSLLPELLQRDLGDYLVEIVTRTSPPQAIYQSDSGEARPISSNADASVGLFEVPYEGRPGGSPPMFGRGPGSPGSRQGSPSAFGPGPGPGSGRWVMFVRNRAGSLEAVVLRARRLNLAVTTGVLLLLLASAAALIRFTRRAQKLAELQMGFVAGVSHELRTPLAVLHTAGYNLRGKMAHNPAQVERYGALIQQESGRLKDLVEQVLRFAGAEAGQVIHQPEPLSVEAVIDDTMESSKAVIDVSQCVIEKDIEPGLPLILGDSMALKHALQNLLSNAAKYGAKESNWIGIFASKAIDHGRTMVEIRVADRGPGIPQDEQAQIFDPFFRGQRAVQDQVHGTGLGLNLVKKIVEAHGGTIRVKSEPMKGAEFIVRIPEAAGASV